MEKNNQEESLPEKLAQKSAEFRLNLMKKQIDFDEKRNIPTVLPEIYSHLNKLYASWKLDKKRPSFLELPFENILKEKYDEKNQIKLMNYLSRVHDDAAYKMLNDESFAQRFISTDEFKAVIFSVDIRRSTDLMLKCQSPNIYADFINALTTELTESVKNRFGIYDKFTGDGLLAFFPNFYSGTDAILYSLLCSHDCQIIFNTVFDSYKKYFSLDKIQTGLGIGIDIGNVYKAGLGMEYTVIGKPVVYACRFSAAPADHTYLTEDALSNLLKHNKESFSITKTSIPIKHEAPMCAYDVKFNSEENFDNLKTTVPDWYEEK